MVSMMAEADEAEGAVTRQRQQQRQQQQLFVSTSATSADSWCATADYVRAKLSIIQVSGGCARSMRFVLWFECR